MTVESAIAAARPELVAIANGTHPRASPAPGRAQTLRELDVGRMLREDPPPIPWLAEPLLVRGCLTMLAGREGQGKSWIALAVAVALGNAATIAGIPCTQGRALYVDGENGPNEAHRRLRHLAGATAEQLVYVEAEGFHLGTNMPELDALLTRHQPALTVLDSYRSLWPGGEENDSGAVEPALRSLISLARRRNTAILLLHHAGKVGTEYRGSTAIGAAVELGFTLRRHDGDPDARERRELVCWKSRPAPEPDARWMRLTHSSGLFSLEDAEPYITAAAPRRATVGAAVADSILRELHTNGPQSRPDLLRAIGADPKDRTARRVVEQLLEDQLITRLDDEQLAIHPRVATGGATPNATPTVAGGITPFRDDTCHLPPPTRQSNLPPQTTCPASAGAPERLRPEPREGSHA